MTDIQILDLIERHINACQELQKQYNAKAQRARELNDWDMFDINHNEQTLFAERESALQLLYTEVCEYIDEELTNQGG